MYSRILTLCCVVGCPKRDRNAFNTHNSNTKTPKHSPSRSASIRKEMIYRLKYSRVLKLFRVLGCILRDRIPFNTDNSNTKTPERSPSRAASIRKDRPSL